MIIETEYPMRLHLTAEVAGDDMGIPEDWGQAQLREFLSEIGERTNGSNPDMRERARSRRADYNSLSYAVSRSLRGDNAVLGLVGEQRVRCAAPEPFQDNFIPGCWIISNYSEGETRRMLFLVHDHDIANPLPEDVSMDDLPNLDEFSSLSDFFGLPSFYCIPYARIPEDLPNMPVINNAQLDQYLRGNNLPSKSNAARESAAYRPINRRGELLSVVNSVFSKIDYVCVDLSNPNQIHSLAEVLDGDGHGFPPKVQAFPQFAKRSASELDGLSDDSIREEFWERHLRWKIECLVRCSAADVDALYRTIDGTFLPVEIKTKSMAEGGGNNPDWFGIDVSTLAKYLLFSLGEGNGEGIYLVKESKIKFLVITQ